MHLSLFLPQLRYIFIKECNNLDPATIQPLGPSIELSNSIPNILQPFLRPQNKQCEISGNTVIISPLGSSSPVRQARIYYDFDYYYEGEVYTTIPHGRGRLTFPHSVSVETEFVQGVWQSQGVIRTGRIAVEAKLLPWSHFEVSPVIPFVLDPTAQGIGSLVKNILRVWVGDEEIPLSTALCHSLCSLNLSQSSLSIELNDQSLLETDESALDERVRSSFSVNTLFVSQEQSNLYTAMARMMGEEIDCWNELPASNYSQSQSLPIVDSICSLCPVRSLHFHSLSHPVLFTHDLPPSVQDCSFTSSPFTFSESYRFLRTLILECSPLFCSCFTCRLLPSTTAKHSARRIPLSGVAHHSKLSNHPVPNIRSGQLAAMQVALSAQLPFPAFSGPPKQRSRQHTRRFRRV